MARYERLPIYKKAMNLTIYPPSQKTTVLPVDE